MKVYTSIYVKYIQDVILLTVSKSYTSTWSLYAFFMTYSLVRLGSNVDIILITYNCEYTKLLLKSLIKYNAQL